MSEGSAAPAAAPAAAPTTPTSAAAAIATPAAAAPPAAAPTGDPAPAAAPTGDAKWYANIDERHHGLIESRHWENQDSMLDSYTNLEKLRGVPDDQLLKMPLAEDVDGMNELYNRLGRPETAEGYAFEKGEGWTDEYTKWYTETMHDLGMSEKQAAGLQAKHAEFEASNTAAMNEAKTVSQVNEMKEWQNDMGAAYEEKLQSVKEGANKLGWSNEDIVAMEGVLGTKKLMNTLSGLGESMGEAKFSGNGSENTPPPAGTLTREAAKKQYAELNANQEFRNQLMSGDPAISKLAQEKRAAISRIAHD